MSAEAASEPPAARHSREIYVEEAGSGPAVVLTHGFGGSCRTWDAQFALLEPRYRTLRWDLLGHGQSAVPEDPEGCNDVERALLRELQRLLKSMQGVMTRCDSPHLQTRAFYVQANLLVASLLSRRESFFKKMEEFHDRSGRA